MARMTSGAAISGRQWHRGFEYFEAEIEPRNADPGNLNGLLRLGSTREAKKPRSAMNSRRLIRSPHRRTAARLRALPLRATLRERLDKNWRSRNSKHAASEQTTGVLH